MKNAIGGFLLALNAGAVCLALVKADAGWVTYGNLGVAVLVAHALGFNWGRA